MIAAGLVVAVLAGGGVAILTMLGGNDDDDDALDAEGVTAEVRSQVDAKITAAGRLLEPLGLESVTCPNEVKKERGGRFRCTVTLTAPEGSVRMPDDRVIETEGGTARLPASVTQEDGEGKLSTRITLPVALQFADLFATAEATYELTQARILSRARFPSAAGEALFFPGPVLRIKLTVAADSTRARDRATDTERVTFSVTGGRGVVPTPSVTETTSQEGRDEATMTFWFSAESRAAARGATLEISTPSAEGRLELPLR